MDGKSTLTNADSSYIYTMLEMQHAGIEQMQTVLEADKLPRGDTLKLILSNFLRCEAHVWRMLLNKTDEIIGATKAAESFKQTPGKKVKP